MLFVPPPRGLLRTANWSGQLLDTSGTTVTGGASHTLGASFTELIASLSHGVFWIKITVPNTRTGATNTDQLLNIYRGANGSEQPLIMGLLSGWSGDYASGAWPKQWNFPVFLPAGTRITAKLQGVIASDTAVVQIECLGGYDPPHWVGTGVETLGAVTGSSCGTDITTGGASEGSFTDIGATTRQYGYVMISLGGNNDTTSAAGVLNCDIGVSTSALPGLEDFIFMKNGGEYGHHEAVGRFCQIPTGVTLRLRGQASSGAEIQDFCIHGVY